MKRPKNPSDYHDRPEADRGGKDRVVILDLVRRRLEGGAPPTPGAYARALEQWQKLPGAVVHVPATEMGAQETRDRDNAAMPTEEDAPRDER